MTVYYKCSSCSQENQLKTNAATRIEFAMARGNRTKQSCKNCHITKLVMVNDLYAKNALTTMIIAGGIFLLGSAFGVYFLLRMIAQGNTILGLIPIASGLLIPVWIYTILHTNDQLRVRSFNQTYVNQ